jgi:DNA invertase Pin-like site-specific DNA recombinase
VLFTILGAFADFDRTRIAQRISEVKQEQKANEFWTGGQPPFGYRVKEDGRLEANPEQVDALAAIHRWRGRVIVSGKSRTTWIGNSESSRSLLA